MGVMLGKSWAAAGRETAYHLHKQNGLRRLCRGPFAWARSGGFRLSFCGVVRAGRQHRCDGRPPALLGSFKDVVVVLAQHVRVVFWMDRYCFLVLFSSFL